MPKGIIKVGVPKVGKPIVGKPKGGGNSGHGTAPVVNTSVSTYFIVAGQY